MDEGQARPKTKLFDDLELVDAMPLLRELGVTATYQMVWGR
jgi:hypothetical protein